MYSASEKEKEFYSKTETPKKLEDLQTLSDRELLERQTLYLASIKNSNDRIKANLQFWFYAGIGIAVITLLYFL